MPTEIKHTPIPWLATIEYSGKMSIVATDRPLTITCVGATVEDYRNAAFIVKAVNNHEKLKERVLFHISKYLGWSDAELCKRYSDKEILEFKESQALLNQLEK